VKPISDGLSSSLFALLVNQWLRFFVVYRVKKHEINFQTRKLVFIHDNWSNHE